MRMCTRTIGFAAVLFLMAQTASAIVIGQIDNFGDGTTQGWTIGNPASPFAPQQVASGGPGGVGDGFLRLMSSGTPGPGANLVTFNEMQWSGDFLSAGITGISLVFNNLGTSPVHLRLAFSGGEGATFGFFATTMSLDLAPGSGWQQVLFPISGSALSPVNGPADFDSVFGSISQIRILSSLQPEFSGDLIAATVGVDNITAVPEPETIVLLVFGVLLLGWHATRCPGPMSRRSGFSPAQRASANGQRVRKTQPEGGSSGDGKSPSI